MADSVQLISVFIGSPSGLEEERRAAFRIVQEINQANSPHWGCQLKLVGWEETLPGHGRPQELINQELDRCDYFIGVLFDHWGSPTGSGESKYSSGFQEEFERAKLRISAGQMRDMTVFFREIPIERQRDPGQSLQKVMLFRKECFEKRDALYQEYVDVQEFDSKVRAKLTAIGWSEFQRQEAKIEVSDKAEKSKLSENVGQPTDGEKTQLLAEKTKEFLTEIIERSSGWEETSSCDVARLRLVAASLHRSGNDDVVLGNHDANVIFRNRSVLELPDAEIQALLNCGIQGFDHQNTPLWHWLSEYEKPENFPDYLNFMAAIGPENQQPNAIRLLTLFGKQPSYNNEFLTREHVLNRWMSEEAKPAVFTSAIKFLRQLGKAEDIELLEKFYTEFTSQRQAAVGQAIIAIMAKAGEASAIEHALKLGIDELDDLLGDKLFIHPSSLKTELLLQSLDSPASGIRRRAVAILNERHELDPNIADTLLSDPDYSVRFYAAEALKIMGHELANDLVKKALTVVKKTPSLGLFSRNETDKAFYDKYQLNRLLEKDFSELNDVFENGDLFDIDETKALLIGHTRKVQRVLRGHLEDGFEQFFSARMERLKLEVGSEDGLIERSTKLIPSLRRDQVSLGLEALAKLRAASDLSLIRSVVDAHEVYFSEAIHSYFAKFGNWSDLPRIKKIKDFRLPEIGYSILDQPRGLEHKAAAMLSIARTRIADLLSEDLGFSLRRAVLSGFSQKDVTGLGDDTIIQGLNNKDDESRVILALKCSQFLPKKRLKELLEKYVDLEGHRYYNSIHWLDLGVSMSRKIAQSVAKHELANRI